MDWMTGPAGQQDKQPWLVQHPVSIYRFYASPGWKTWGATGRPGLAEAREWPAAFGRICVIGETPPP